MSNVLLQVQDVTVRFGGIVALDGVSFDVAEGDIVGLIGPNGAGKTTLFNCLSRLYTPDNGDIMFEEELHALAVYLSTLKDPDGKTPRPVFVKTTVEHGFTVYGFVRDKSGKPVAGIKVQAKPLKKHGHPGSGATNEQGYYEIFLHLHNEDTGTKIVVSGKGAQAEIVADYDPTDHVTKRQASVDLVVGS